MSEHTNMAAKLNALIETPLTLVDLGRDPTKPVRYEIGIRTTKRDEKEAPCMCDGCGNTVGDIGMECFRCARVRPICINHISKAIHDLLITDVVEPLLCVNCQIKCRLNKMIRADYDSGSDSE